ncbi:hypothetical protein ONE63_000962 [Megalurothrips usitatus]|uniref:Ribosome assembly factor mrt4 n=1 Tax=Megalurothrips usitatus TaxID=439358 RepID=A0AAV7Y048_9NEOP|nr:hypothetical protein ONE63_000962 [Megalurothrips usitatus]
MPRGKRDKKITLSQTDKKGLPHKQKLVEDLRKCVDKYDTIFVFSTENMRNAKLKDLREEWKNDSRFFFGKQTVMQLGLGKTPEEEYQDNLHKISKQLTGQCGLLFTNRSENEVRDYFGTYAVPEFARSGVVATETITLPEGPLPDFPFDSEVYLRKLGMPTTLQKGVVTLLADYDVCKEGKRLTPAQAQILKLLGKQMAEFRLNLKCLWRKDGGKVKRLKDISNTASKGTNGDENFSLRMDTEEDVMD